MTEILPNLWLGSLDDALNINFITENNINCIINCTINKEFINMEIEYKYRIPIKDDKSLEEQYLLFCLLDKIVEIITNHYINRDRILIHCFAGKQRSLTCLLAFLITHTKMPVKECLSLIQKKRPCAGMPEFNFYKTIKYYKEKSNQKRAPAL